MADLEMFLSVGTNKCPVTDGHINPTEIITDLGEIKSLRDTAVKIQIICRQYSGNDPCPENCTLNKFKHRADEILNSSEVPKENS